MSSTAPQTGEAQAKHRNPWPWIALGIGVLAVGLLVWALILRSDRNEADDQAQATAGAVLQMQQANDELSGQLGVTSESLEAAESDVADSEQARQDDEDRADAAEQQAADAQQQAQAAKDKAAKAKDDSARSAAESEEAQAQAAAAQAQSEQTQADADAADARGAIVADCAKAYAAAVGEVFGADDRKAALDAAKTQIADITDTCQAALSGG
jgi:hypothetical protein